MWRGSKPGPVVPAANRQKSRISNHAWRSLMRIAGPPTSAAARAIARPAEDAVVLGRVGDPQGRAIHTVHGQPLPAPGVRRAHGPVFGGLAEQFGQRFDAQSLPGLHDGTAGQPARRALGRGLGQDPVEMMGDRWNRTVAE